MPTPPQEHRFRPGQSGNPTGSSKRQRFTNALIALIDEKQADRALATVWLQQALGGDFKFFKELLDRTEGKVAAPEPEAETDVIECVSDAEQRAIVHDHERATDPTPDP